MNSSSFFSVMITCEDREAQRALTLESYHKSDLAAVPLRVVYDHEANLPSHTRKQTRQERVSLLAIERALQVPDWKFLLFFEDDLEFNPHILHNLRTWPVLDSVILASLYNPNVAGPGLFRGEPTALVADPGKIYGSQAFVLSRVFAQHCARHWWGVEGMQDIKISRLAGRSGAIIFYHTPSLVQHAGRSSTWTSDDRFHQAADYSAQFKRALA